MNWGGDIIFVKLTNFSKQINLISKNPKNQLVKSIKDEN